MDASLKMRRPRVLMLMQLPPPVHGAALRNLSLAESSILREALDIHVREVAFTRDLKEIGRFSLAKWVRFVALTCRLTTDMLRIRPDIVYFTLTPSGPAFLRDVALVALIRLSRVPLVLHLRGLGMAEGMRTWLGRCLRRFVLRKAHVICLSEGHTSDLGDLPNLGVYVVPNGIRCEVAAITERKPGVPQILYLSHYVRTKGVLDFIGALGFLREEGVEFNAVTVGADYDVTRSELEALSIRHGLADRLTIHGPIEGKEKFSAMLRADIFVLPTYWELFPGVVLEAMQCGCAIVSTRTGAISEIISHGQTGLLVASRNQRELADVMKSLVNDPAFRKSLGDAARARYLERYTLEVFERRVRDVLLEISTRG